MEMKGALTLPRNEDTFWFDTAVALMKGKEQEILAEKGDRPNLPKEKGGNDGAGMGKRMEGDSRDRQEMP